MAAPVIQLRSRVAVAHRAGKPVSESDVAISLTGDCDVYKPSGEPLLLLRKRALSAELCESAYPALHELKKYGSDNRGKYAGFERTAKPLQGTGAIPKNTRTRDENGKLVVVPSAIVGYFDRQGGRFPFCRQTAFVGKEPEKWASVMPMVDEVAALFKRTLPARYAKQQALADKTNAAFRIGKTPFTTLTVNNNVVGSLHTDKGDYKEGFGVISVVRRGTYQGGWLTFPEYGAGVDLEDGDVVFFNSHDWHGVTPFHHTEEGFERISVVYYYRARMIECGSPAEEAERARKRYGAIE